MMRTTNQSQDSQALVDYVQQDEQLVSKSQVV